MQTDVTVPDEPKAKGSLACFQDQGRICGSDCMAYLPQPPAGTAYQGENWAHCLLLVNAERAGKHVIIIADLLKRSKSEATRNQAPPGVT